MSKSAIEVDNERMERVKKSLPYRNTVDPKQTIADWFKECNSRGILPWEYDLKEEIYFKLNLHDGPIERLLNSWAGNYFSPLYFKKVGIKGFVDMETEDCDLMQCIYEILWGKKSKYAYKSIAIDKDNDFDADIMNSFWKPYKDGLTETGACKTWNGGDYQKEDPGDFEELLIHFNDGGYRGVNIRFEKLAKLAHTIGNCTLVPYGFNVINKTKGHKDKSNTWSQALERLLNTQGTGDGYWSKEISKLVSKDGPKDEQKNYIKKYFMDSYVGKDKKIVEYGYTDKDYITKVENSITERGKVMVKELCNELEKKHPEIKEYKFYKELF